jgi:hypothetical protein
VLVVQATGWGKSAVYWAATAALRANAAGPTLVVSPLLALMRDQIAAAERAALRAATVNSTNSAQEGDQLGDRGDPEDLDPFDQLRLSGLPQRHDHPREACLLSRQGRWHTACHCGGPAGRLHAGRAAYSGCSRYGLMPGLAAVLAAKGVFGAEQLRRTILLGEVWRSVDMSPSLTPSQGGARAPRRFPRIIPGLPRRRRQVYAADVE